MENTNKEPEYHKVIEKLLSEIARGQK